LNAEQKAAVDAFIQQNPDLAIELTALQQTVMPSTAIHFEGKELLFKNEDAFINATNSEEKFLLYVDDELNNNEKTAVETFVLQHPQLQQAFTALKQTKLEAETIPYPYKETLYRKAERRVVYLSWQRISIAAAVLGLIVLSYSLFNQKPAVVNGGEFAVTKPATVPSDKAVSVKDKTTNTAVTTTENKEDKTVATTEKSAPTQPKKSNNLPVPLNNTQQQNIIIPDNNTSVAQNRPAIKNNDIVTTPQETIAVKSDFSEKPIVTTAAVKNDNNNYVQQAVYKELNTDEEENNPVYVGNMKLNKDKVKGLLKKVGRLFNKSRDEEEAKLSIASIPVKQSK
jgi:hypothetical protein